MFVSYCVLLCSYDNNLFYVVRFTARVAELMNVLKDLNHGVYQRTLINSRRTDDDEKKGMLVAYVYCKQLRIDYILKFCFLNSVAKKISSSELTRKRGEIIETDHLIR